MEDVIESIFSDLKKQSLTDFEMVFVNDGGGEKMSTILDAFAAQGGLSVAGGCRCLAKELDMIAC